MNSQILGLSTVQEGVAMVQMQDRVNKNTFTQDMTESLIEAFQIIGEDSSIRSVVLCGFEQYFASGGTKESLLDIQSGKINFAVEYRGRHLYDLLLQCPVPVVAAMQGHGIGAGLTLGLQADFVVMSRECFYAANYMKFGFTPGFGASCILPERLGSSLGNEMLMNAETFQGAELERRGVPFPVLPRGQVVEKARELAAQLAQKPRRSLVLLKAHLNRNLKLELASCIQQELTLHEQTIHEPEVQNRIMDLYR